MVPMDYGDAIAYAIAAATFVAGYFVTKRTRSTSSSRNVNETVDDGVLSQFLKLNDRLTKLELELASTRAELADVKRERDWQIEEALADKNIEIASLKTSLENHRKRIKQLEDNNNGTS
jgi:chromosome segregation ATPase